MRDTIFICGVDDKKQVSFEKKGDGKYQVNITNGITPISLLIDNVEPIKSKKILHIIGVHDRLKLTKKSTEYNVFNLIGDSESSSISLNALKKFTNTYPVRRVFNPPHLIEQTSRKNLPETLTGIKGIKLPKVISCKAKSIKELSSSIKEHNFQYPVIIRKKGYHNGMFAELVLDENELVKLNDWLDENTEFYLIEFLNVKANDSDFYHKYRISVIDGKFYPQHLLSCDTWKVMARQQCMIEHPELRKIEQYFMENFKTSFLKTHKDKLEAIHERIKLDYYGIDFAINNQGELIIFEANSCMSLLDYWRGNNEEFDYKIPSRIAVRQALFDLITTEI